MEKMVYTVKEAAQVLGVCLPKMYDLVHSEGFPVTNLGNRKTVIAVDALREWLKNGGLTAKR